MGSRISRRLLSVIIPAYKQEKTIRRDLHKINNVLDQLRYRYEMIVVIDGMEDRTFEFARGLNLKNVKVTGYRTNQGKGHAVRFGMRKAKGDIVAFIDSGMDINPNGISMLLEHFEWYKADIIIGSKLHPVSKVSYPLLRRFMSLGYRVLVRILFGLSIRDTQVGLKLFRRRVLSKVLPRLLVKTYAFDIEILAVAHRIGFKRIYEAPIELDFKPSQTITSRSFWRIIFLMLWDTLAVFYRLRILRYYDKTSRRFRYHPELGYRVNLP